MIGLGQGETFVASDLPALVPLTSSVMFMNAGEVAVLTADEVQLTTLNGESVDRAAADVVQNPMTAAKGEFKHFMQKEMMHQAVTARSLDALIRGTKSRRSVLAPPDPPRSTPTNRTFSPLFSAPRARYRIFARTPPIASEPGSEL